jgi:hypothetical protein
MKKKTLVTLLERSCAYIETLEDLLECERESKEMWRKDYDESMKLRLKEKEEWEAAREIDKRIDENGN